MQSIRCKKKNCNTKLGEFNINDGELEIICPKCGAMNRLEARLKPQVTISIVEKEQSR